MTLGRFRDVPEQMDDVECAVAAAQYPEGGLMAGMGAGITIPLLTEPSLVVVGPFVGALSGYALGRWVRARKLRALRDRPGSGERLATDGGG